MLSELPNTRTTGQTFDRHGNHTLITIYIVRPVVGDMTHEMSHVTRHQPLNGCCDDVRDHIPDVIDVREEGHDTDYCTRIRALFGVDVLLY